MVNEAHECIELTSKKHSLFRTVMKQTCEKVMGVSLSLSLETH